MNTFNSLSSSQKSSIKRGDLKISQLKIAKADDEEKSQTFQDFMRTFFDYKLIEFVPIESIRHVDQKFIKLIGISIWISYIVFYLYFFITQMTQVGPYIASSESGAGNNFITCNAIDKPITDMYRVDKNGRWSTNSFFSSVEGMYIFHFFDLMTTSQYEIMISSVESEIERIGKLAKTQVLAKNILYWNNFLYKIPLGGNSHKFEFSGEANILWNMHSFAITLVSNGSTCSPNQHSYDVFSSNLEMIFTNDYFIQKCENITSRNILSHEDGRLVDQVVISLDFRSFMLPVGINNNITTLDHLQEVSNNYFQSKNITYNGAIYSRKLMFDDRFGRHTPFLCYQKTSGSDTISAHPIDNYCFVRLGKAIAIPIFSHFGTLSGSCNCTVHDDYCNDFDFLATLVIFPQINIETDFSYYEDNYSGNAVNITKLFDIVTRYGRDELINIIQSASRKALTGQTFANIFPVYDIIDDNNPTAFCDHECALYVINGYNQYNSYSRAISDSFFQLKGGAHCQDSFTTESFGNIKTQFPQSLTENYVECVDGNYYKFLNSLGIANGNVQIAIPFIISCLIPLVYAWLHYTNRIPEREKYSKNERDVAIDALADIILSVRDQGDNVAGLSKNNPVRSLAQGLIDYAHTYECPQVSIGSTSTHISNQSSGKLPNIKVSNRKCSIFVKGDTKIAPDPSVL